MPFKISPLFLFIILLVIIFGVSTFGPAERTLGENVRLVYLHGAWVWTSLFGFVASAAIGLAGFILNRETLHRWSIALGRSGLVFWLTYLPLSLWTMQLNWNGLFLDEPRWRVAIDFAIAGILIQVAIAIIQRAHWGSLINIAFISALAFALVQTDQVMHPNSPIASSGSVSIQGFFGILTVLCITAGLLLARWLHNRQASY
jgi:heme/copper-type cytochrome/quinol oxidase subunit 4